MSDIYCHEDVINFTNPFLDFEQGYQALRKSTTIPVSPKTVLLEKPLTRIREKIDTLQVLRSTP